MDLGIRNELDYFFHCSVHMDIVSNNLERVIMKMTLLKIGDGIEKWVHEYAE